MKRFHIPVLLVFALSLVFLTSCFQHITPVTPVAYTRFDTSPDLTVYYTSDMYSGQIKVYDGEYVVYSFTFNRCLGRDEMEGKAYTLVDVSRKPDMSVSVLSLSEYSADKNFYLNGQKLVPDEVSVFEFGASYVFTDIDGFIRTNPDGTLIPENVNYIEYK